MIGFFQRESEAGGVGAAVAFDHHAAQAEKNRAVVAAGVEAIAHAVERGFGRQAAEFVEQAAVELFADGSAHKFDRAFDGFEHDVADKTVGGNHVGRAAEQAVGFNVADEIQAALAQQGEGLFDHFCALDFFGTDIEQADARVGIQAECFDQLAAHRRELDDLRGAAVDIGAQIQRQRKVAVFAGQEFGDGGALDTGQGFEHETGGGHQRAGVAGGYRGLRFAGFHLLDGNAHRRVFFVFQRRLRRFVHFHHLRGVADGDFVQRRLCRGQRRMQTALVADHNQAGFGAARQKAHRRRHGNVKADVAAHRIDGQGNHRVCLPFDVWFSAPAFRLPEHRK